MIPQSCTSIYLPLNRQYYLVYIAQTGRQGGFFATLLMVVSMIVLGVYAIILLYLLFRSIYSRMFGSGEIMLTEIDEKTYIIVMRHNQYQWVLLPCEIEDYFVEKMKGTKNDINLRIGIKRALFTRGLFIMRDLSELPEPISYRTGFSVTEKK